MLSGIYPENAPWLAALIGNLCVFAYFVIFCKQFSDMGLHSADNICMITSGYSVKEEIEGFFNAAREFIAEKDAGLLWSSLFEPFLSAVRDGRKLPCSFLVLEKDNGGHSVILRYDSPKSIIEKAPSAGLFDGQTDEKEMGVTYRAIDEYLTEGTGSEEDLAIIRRYHSRSEHKRRPIPTYPGSAS